ncbi:MAG: hypothetical protein JKX76_05235 [Colwellia sp.]|nr:hypothetical protein [Colwellia sp.]
MLNCHLIVTENSNHLQQVYFGFQLLQKAGLISLKQTFEFDSPNFAKNQLIHFGAQSGGLKLIINSSIRVFYDMADSHDINEKSLAWADFYFKRSYSEERHTDISTKILPLDLNYMVKPEHVYWQSLTRAFHLSSGSERIKVCIRELDIKNKISYLPRINELQAEPSPNEPFKVLFMCRLWEPDKDDHWQLTKAQQEDRIEINHVRVDCIRKLKKEFGKEFTGGLAPTAYAQKNFSDVVSSASVTSKRNYIAQLKKYPVCISTTGLANSIGWKFGEYVALSRAIVSEKLHSQTAGNIQEQTNYLPFSTADECIEQVHALRDNKALMLSMMQANHHYYNNHLAPDKLIMSSLQRALNLTQGAC